MHLSSARKNRAVLILDTVQKTSKINGNSIALYPVLAVSTLALPMSVSLPPVFYYLDNFQRVLDWVAQRYGDLLLREEQDFIDAFPALPQASRALLVRMVMRKGCLFRAAKLCYDEIGNPDAAALPLIEQGWLQRDPVITLDEVFGLLTKAEIVAAFGCSPQEKMSSKPELLAALRDRFADARSFSAWGLQMQEQVYRVDITAWCERLRLMFFGNLHQDWSEFVLSDLGIYRYEQVEFSPSSRGFVLRQDVDDYLHLQRCRESFDQGDYLDDILPDIPALPFENQWLETRRNKLLFRLAQQYERCREWQAALGIYRRCTYPGARLREIRVLERCEEIGAAYRLAKQAFDTPQNEAEQQALQRILPRLRRKLGHARLHLVKRQTVDRIDLLLPCPTQDATVEHIVCAHYACDESPVLYVENTLINSLFGLLCWRAIFAPLPGAFFHPFHHGPADLQTPDFHQRRAELFTACLSQLDSDQYKQTIVDHFHAKQNIQSPFVFWNSLDESLLQLALDCLPAAHLKKWFERMLLDISSNRSGFPDLIQFWPQEKRYRMIEVKGPGDRLQDNQKRWLDYCVAHQMPVAVCYVQWHEEVA